ncbi:hypothetical protein B0I35DRAFT_405957 [Stachybotrys elegans]|uniref:Granulins domain-containing protein n=1 Tax=Stachybotrys elegans TaxID=80388 RepID=A0A8K0T0M8_9HYPO|nr:hypothetical protein B0I35DRAFT_405957 [Stachybotrys elegans]
MGPSLRFLVAFTSALHVTTTAASSPATLSYDPVATALFKRQAQCPGDYFQCPTSLGAAFEDICCVNGQRCAFDENNQPACCPSGAVCTGTAPNPTQTDAPVSFVPNTYFTFPYAPTTFADSGACSSAFELRGMLSSGRNKLRVIWLECCLYFLRTAEHIFLPNDGSCGLLAVGGIVAGYNSCSYQGRKYKSIHARCDLLGYDSKRWCP